MSSEPATKKSDALGYGKIIWAAAYLFGAVGAIVGLAMSVIGVYQVGSTVLDTRRMLTGVIGAPVILGLLASALGISLTCAVAPASYLGSRKGREWMNVIGTQTVIGARVVCVVLGIILTTLFVLAIWVVCAMATQPPDNA